MCHVKRWLELKKINYEELNISENDEARQTLISKGLIQLPQVKIDDEFIKFEVYNDILKYL